MLVGLPNHLGPRVASGVVNVSVKISENGLVLGVGEEDVVRE